MDDERLDEIERDLGEAERTLDRLEDGTYWSQWPGELEPTGGTGDTGDTGDTDVTIELDPDVTAELSVGRDGTR